jgi:hypothetical protein
MYGKWKLIAPEQKHAHLKGHTIDYEYCYELSPLQIERPLIKIFNLEGKGKYFIRFK